MCLDTEITCMGCHNNISYCRCRKKEKKEILVEDPDTGATKADGQKLRYDLLPVQPLEDVVAVLTYGATKYSDHNWKPGMKWNRPFSACMRHLWAWWRGEDKDPETGFSHLAHAICNLLFLAEYEYTRKEYDNRPR